jgi:transcriptional regulator with XRE-family HTH domain
MAAQRATQPEHGRQIAAVRAVLRLRMDDLASAAGLHRQSILYNERKEHLPRYGGYAAERIAEALAPLGVTFETRDDAFAVVFRPAAE